MRHVITGGSGFTGKRLIEAVAARGEEAVVFDLVAPGRGAEDKVSFVQGDIRNADDVARVGLKPGDVVHHLAARQFHGEVPKTGRDAWFADVNVEGTRVVLEAMAKGGADRLVFFSTDMTYGVPSQTPVPAGHAQAPIGPYGRSKLAAEKLLLAAVAEKDLRATIFRPRLISGAGRLGVLAKLFKLVQIGAPVPMIGSGRNRYQMIAVDDCAAAALRAADLGCPTGPFNLGSDNPPTVRELLTELIRRAH
jgi:dTDP-glucose 4,6-dehydratase